MSTKRAQARTSHLRWWIAGQLNKSRRYCWADLVSWVLRYDGYSLTEQTGKRCSVESPCYCGKFKAAKPEVSA